MRETLLSVGIDIGTSTTQLVISRLTLENTNSSYTVPRVEITDKEVIYRSSIYFTPLLPDNRIDAGRIREIVQTEYGQAGIDKKQLRTGAVIITGEAARRENADQVLQALSSYAGDFVVATAGPELEAVLSARGAGADILSGERRCAVVNLDIGGGTTNLAIYEKGVLKGVTCLDIGGRLVRIEQGRIAEIFPKIGRLAKANGISISEGQKVDISVLKKLCGCMAGQLAQAVYLLPMDENHRMLYTNEEQPLPAGQRIDAVTFSGGVADAIYLCQKEKQGTSSGVQTPQGADTEFFRYGDIGILLGQAVCAEPHFHSLAWYTPAETIRATVVGAGSHTTSVSGSTITYESGCLPIKNIPVLRVDEQDEKSTEAVTASIQTQIPLFETGGVLPVIAIALSGSDYKSFSRVQELAQAILQGAKRIADSDQPLVIVLEEDIAKVLGNAVQIQLGQRKQIVCIDGICARSGDYMDIGEPMAAGQVLPVVIKTLIFNNPVKRV